MTVRHIGAQRPPGRPTRPAGRASLLWDVSVVLILALLDVVQLLLVPGQGWVSPLMSVGLAVVLPLPLFWRRRAPLAIFIMVAVIAVAQFSVVGVVTYGMAVLVAFYTVVAYSTSRRAITAAILLEGGVAGAAVTIWIRSGRNVAVDPIAYLIPVGFVTALIIIAGAIGINVKIRRAYLAEVEQRAARLEFERDQQRQLAAAGERSRIAREMHDIIAHNLSVVIALSDGASLTHTADPELASVAMGEVSAAGRAALREMRRVLGVLREDGDTAALSPAPVLADLDGLVRTVERTGMRARFTVQGRLDALAPTLQTTIYRLVQEALTNSVKHASEATQVNVSVRCEGDRVEVTVTDDGASVSAGLPVGPGGAPAGSGHGIIGMRERAAVHDGELHVGPTATGWGVRASFPIEAAAAEPTALPSPTALPVPEREPAQIQL